MVAYHNIRKTVGKVIGVAGYIIQYGCIAHCTLEFVGGFVVCKGPSMEPTINSDDVLLTENVSPRMNILSRGDIVIARSPVDPHQHICKRLAALSGDKVKKGIWYETIPRGHVWLQGDNENNSTDSRNFGPVPQGLIRGRAVLRIWPLSDFGSIKYNNKVDYKS